MEYTISKNNRGNNYNNNRERKVRGRKYAKGRKFPAGAGNEFLDNPFRGYPHNTPQWRAGVAPNSFWARGYTPDGYVFFLNNGGFVTITPDGKVVRERD